MENFKEKLERKNGGRNISRREFLRVLGLAGGAAACFDIKKAIAQESSRDAPSRFEYGKYGWFYTFEEMQNIYEREYGGERILKNPFTKKGEELIGFLDGKEFVVPQEFVDGTLKLLQQLLEQKTARFLFRLDAFHGHFFVPEEVFQKRYADLDEIAQAHRLLLDPNLGVLFHNSEHLKVDGGTPEDIEIYERRNVVGWYNGRGVTVLPLATEIKSTAQGAPAGSRDLTPYLRFAAHKDGVFSITFNGRAIRLDISFDDVTYF